MLCKEIDAQPCFELTASLHHSAVVHADSTDHYGRLLHSSVGSCIACGLVYFQHAQELKLHCLL